MSTFQQEKNALLRDAQLGTQLKQDANLIRSNQPLLAAENIGSQLLHNQSQGSQHLAGQSYGSQLLGNQQPIGHLLQGQALGNQAHNQQTFAQRAENMVGNEVRQLEAKFGHQGSTGLVQGSAPLMNQGSPNRLMHGSPTGLLQGSPTGLLQGSPSRHVGYNQSLGQYSGQGLSTGITSMPNSQFLHQQQNPQFIHSQSNPQQVHIHQTSDYTSSQSPTQQRLQNLNLQGQNYQGSSSGYSNQQQFVSGQNFSTGETIVEKVYEAPIRVTHQEQGVVRSLYEGQEKIQTQENAILQSHQAAPIIKEIHQDVIHEHHKDILVEHKKDVLIEHHQNIIHQHNQPIIYEKHIHEHHQPIIHEKHTTLIEEKHVPIISEQHSHQTNVQENQEIITEVFEKPIVKEVFVSPVVTEVFSEQVIQREGGSGHYSGQNQQLASSGFQNQGFSTGQSFQNPGVQKTVIEETITTSNQPGNFGGVGYVQQDPYLASEHYSGNEIDEFGRPKKQGFFSNLKSKMTGHKHEPKIL